MAWNQHAGYLLAIGLELCSGWALGQTPSRPERREPAVEALVQAGRIADVSERGTAVRVAVAEAPLGGAEAQQRAAYEFWIGRWGSHDGTQRVQLIYFLDLDNGVRFGKSVDSDFFTRKTSEVIRLTWPAGRSEYLRFSQGGTRCSETGVSRISESRGPGERASG